MKGSFADNTSMAALKTYFSLRRMATIAGAAVLAAASVTPALAADQPTGLELAREVASHAVELASNSEDVDVAVTAPPGTTDDGVDPGSQGKGRGQGKGQGKNPADPGKSSEAPGKSGDSEKLTGRDRAAVAIAEALERNADNGNGFGRGHAAVVIEMLLIGESPASLVADENHGAKVSAMVATYNELKSQQAESR